MTIPKILIQTWKTEDLPDRAKVLVDELKLNNPNFKYLFFSDKDIDDFMKTKYPEYIETFNRFKYTIQKIDFFRLLAVYHYGGFYFDIDVSIDKSILELCEHECVFPQEYRKNGDPYLHQKNMYMLVGNYGFGACPKNRFIKYCIDNIVVQKIPIDKIPGEGRHKDKYIFYTTGPVLVTDCYADYDIKDRITIIKPTVYSPYRFGDFGRHHMHGTWE